MCRFFFFSSRRRHTRFDCDWSSDVCSSDLKQRRARSSSAGVVDRRAQKIQRVEKAERGCAGLSERVGPTRQTARIQTKADRLPRETELRSVRIKTRQQVRGRTVLLEFLPPQISAYICDP